MRLPRFFTTCLSFVLLACLPLTAHAQTVTSPATDTTNIDFSIFDHTGFSNSVALTNTGGYDFAYESPVGTVATTFTVNGSGSNFLGGRYAGTGAILSGTDISLNISRFDGASFDLLSGDFAPFLYSSGLPSGTWNWDLDYGAGPVSVSFNPNVTLQAAGGAGTFDTVDFTNLVDTAGAPISFTGLSSIEIGVPLVQFDQGFQLNNITFSSASAVPEPSSAALLGVIGLVGCIRRRRS